MEGWNDVVVSIGTTRDGVVDVATGDDAGFATGRMLAFFFLGVSLGGIFTLGTLGGMDSCEDVVFGIGAETIVSVGFLYVSVARRD